MDVRKFREGGRIIAIKHGDVVGSLAPIGIYSYIACKDKCYGLITDSKFPNRHTPVSGLSSGKRYAQ